MTEVATSVASSRAAGPDGPSIDDLLKAGTFHQRLAAARAEREAARNRLTAASLEVCDGLGAPRVAEAFLEAIAGRP